MKALCKVGPGPGGLQLLELPKPEPTANEVRIRVHYAGICGTDMHIIHDEYDAQLPVILGHEFSGVIDSVGAAVTGFQRSDRVVALTAGFVCGRCRYCRDGLPMQCPERKSIGSGMDGCMAEYLVIRGDRIYHLPDSIPLREAALCEPVACCVRSVIETSGLKAGDYAYVSGPGTIGQLVAQLAKLCGAHVTVAGTDADTQRLRLALELGADAVTQESLPTAPEGAPFDVAFECAGVKASADTCLRVLRRCGRYVQVGLFGKPVALDLDYALIRELLLVSSFAANPSSWETALRLMAHGRLRLEPLTSAVVPLASWREAIKMADAKQGYKLLLQC